jgi:hypothetical protein
LKTLFVVNDRQILSKIQLTPRRLDDKTVTVSVKALFAYLTTREEMEAINRIQEKFGTMNSDFTELSMSILKHRLQTRNYPTSLDELKQNFPKDPYSPSGEDYHYEPQQTRFVLSSCGKDGIYGNEDDWIYLNGNSGNEFRIILGHRYELYPLENE